MADIGLRLLGTVNWEEERTTPLPTTRAVEDFYLCPTSVCRLRLQGL